MSCCRGNVLWPNAPQYQQGLATFILKLECLPAVANSALVILLSGLKLPSSAPLIAPSYQLIDVVIGPVAGNIC